MTRISANAYLRNLISDGDFAAMKENTFNENSSTRILAIDYIKAISIIFIVFSHINGYNESFKLWSICFSPIVFFFSRGMVFKQKITRFSDWKKFLLDRIVSIMAPYFIWALIYAKLEFMNIFKIAYSSHESLSLAGSLTSLWFLPCMFVGDIIFEAVLCISEKTGDRNKGIIFISAMSIIMAAACIFIPHPGNGWPFGADVAVQAAAWIGAGHVTMHLLRGRIFSDSKKKINIIIMIIIAALGLALSFIAYKNTDMPGGYVMVAEARYGNYPIYLLSAIGGTVFIVSLSFILARIKNKIFVKILQMIGTNSMIIFAIHKFVIFTMQDKLSNISLPDTAALLIIFIAAMAVSLIVMPVINIYLPLLAGKMKYKGLWRENKNG